MENVLEFLTNNQEMIKDVLVFGFNCVTGTVFSASVITAVTKTKNSTAYKIIELVALVTKKAKEEIKEGNK